MKTYTVQEIAKILRVRKSFVYELIKNGRLKAIRMSERRFRVTEDALKIFFELEQVAYAQNAEDDRRTIKKSG